jgi:Mn2+/Fe2+ NRAMP family transporter
MKWGAVGVSKMNDGADADAQPATDPFVRPPSLHPNMHRLRRAAIFHRLGPGLITGAADDDPGGIATYSQAGAQFGLNMLWTVPFSYPLLCAIQMISARVGRVTGRGLAANLCRVFPVQ